MKNKIILSIILSIILLITSSTVFAVGRGSIIYWAPDGQGELADTHVEVDGRTYLLVCKQKNGHLRSRYSQNLNDELDGGALSIIENMILNGSSTYWKMTGWHSKSCYGESKREIQDNTDDFRGTKNFTAYKYSSLVQYLKYQDVSYANTITNDIDTIQSIVWADKEGGEGINEGAEIKYNSSSYPDLWDESRAYQQFYYAKQKNGGYKLSDDTDYDEVRVYVNATEGTYTAGPFSISAPGGYFTRSDGTIVPFSEITKLTLTNQSGAEQSIVNILDEEGNPMSEMDYKYSLDGERFYIKFKKTNNTSKVHLKVEYRYLDYCSTDMYKYEGKESSASWSWKSDGDKCYDHNERGKRTSRICIIND